MFNLSTHILSFFFVLKISTALSKKRLVNIKLVLVVSF